MKKKIITLLFTIILSIFLYGCNFTTKADANPKTSNVTTTTAKDTFSDELEQIKKEIISTEPITIVFMNDIDYFIDRNKNKEEVKNGLSKFIVEKWNDNLKLGKKDKNVNDRLSTALGRLYVDYPNNTEVQNLYEQDNRETALKEILAKPPQKSKNLTSSDGMLELLDFKGERGYIVGTIKNNSGNNYNYVEVNINLFDANNNQVGSTLSNIRNLEGHKNWKFNAVVIEKNVTNFKIISIITR